MHPYKKWFDIYKECDVSIDRMDNDLSSKVIRIDTIKVMMFDNVVRKLDNVKHIPKWRGSLIFIKILDTLSSDFSAKNDIMNINKCVLITMKGKKVNILYSLIDKTILGRIMKVESCHEEFFVQVQKVDDDLYSLSGFCFTFLSVNDKNRFFRFRLRWCLFFYLILNRTLIFNSIKY